MFGLGLLLDFVSVLLFFVLLISLITHVSEWRQRTRIRRSSRDARWLSVPPSGQRDLNRRPSPGEDLTATDEAPPWVADPNQNIPDWLVPLLRDRAAAMAIHAEIESSTISPEEVESQLETRIEHLDTEIVTVYQSRQAETTVDDGLDRSIPGLITEAEIEKHAVLDLLGALELQWLEGKISKEFYQRKRTQLRERLAKAVRDTK